MIEIPVQDVPLTLIWAPPADTDLFFISYASYIWLCQIQALNLAGAKIRQATQADIDATGASLTATMDSILATIYTEGG